MTRIHECSQVAHCPRRCPIGTALVGLITDDTVALSAVGHYSSFACCLLIERSADENQACWVAKWSTLPRHTAGFLCTGVSRKESAVVAKHAAAVPRGTLRRAFCIILHSNLVQWLLPWPLLLLLLLWGGLYFLLFYLLFLSLAEQLEWHAEWAVERSLDWSFLSKTPIILSNDSCDSCMILLRSRWSGLLSSLLNRLSDRWAGPNFLLSAPIILSNDSCRTLLRSRWSGLLSGLLNGLSGRWAGTHFLSGAPIIQMTAVWPWSLPSFVPFVHSFGHSFESVVLRVPSLQCYWVDWAVCWGEFAWSSAMVYRQAYQKDRFVRCLPNGTRWLWVYEDRLGALHF